GGRSPRPLVFVGPYQLLKNMFVCGTGAGRGGGRGRLGFARRDRAWVSRTSLGALRCAARGHPRARLPYAASVSFSAGLLDSFGVVEVGAEVALAGVGEDGEDD